MIDDDKPRDDAVEKELAGVPEDLLDRARVLAMLEEHRAGRAEHSRRLWALLCFVIWHGIFVERRIVPVVPEPRHALRV